MSLARVFAALSLGAALGLTGCVGYTVAPPRPAAPLKADTPSKLRVAVSVKTEPFDYEGFGISRSAVDRYRGWTRFKPMFEQVDHVGDKFVEALKASGAFASVEELRPGSLGVDRTGSRDLMLEAKFTGKYKQDPGMFAKSFMTGFLLFLPAPFLRYDDTYTTGAELTVYDNGLRLLHKYNEQQEATTSAALFSAGQPGSITAGVQSAAENLAAKLVAALIADRETFGSGSAARPVAKRQAERPAAAEPAAEAASLPPAEPAAQAPLKPGERPVSKRNIYAEDDMPAPTRAAAQAPRAPAPAPAVRPAAAQPEAVAAQPEPAEEPAQDVARSKAKRPRISSAEAAAELLP